MQALAREPLVPQEAPPDPNDPKNRSWARNAVSYLNPVRTGAAVLRGAEKAGQSFLRLSSWLGLHGRAVLTSMTHEEADEYMDWYTDNVDHTLDEVRQRVLGRDAQDGTGRFIEGVSQFLTGYAFGGGVLKAAGVGVAAGEGAAAATSLAARALPVLAKGAIADFTAFAPSTERLSNLAANGPGWFSNPLTRFLATQETDNEITARLKASAEGTILAPIAEVGMRALGIAFRRFLGVNQAKAALLATRATRTAELARQGKISPEIASESIRQDLAAAAQLSGKSLPTDVVAVAQNADGRWALAEVDNGTPKAVSADAPSFATRAEAEQHAAVLNDGARNSRINPEAVGEVDPMDRPAFQRRGADRPVPQHEGGVGNPPVNPARARQYVEETLAGMSPEAREEYLRTVRNISEDATPETVAREVDQSPIEMNDVQTPEQATHVIDQVASGFPGELHINGKRVTAEQALNLVRDIAADISPERWLQFAEALDRGRGAVEQRLAATRVWFEASTKRLKQLASTADAFPDDPIAQRQLARAIDTVANLQRAIAGVRENADAGVAQGVKDEATVAGRQVRSPGDPIRITAGRTPDEIRAMGRLIMSADDPSEVLAALNTPRSIPPRGVSPQSWLDRVLAYRMEAMLSGPRTQVVNAVSNAVATFQMPIERWWAGAISRNSALRHEGWDMMTSAVGAINDSFRAMKKAMRMGENVLDPGRTHVGQEFGLEHPTNAWAEQSWLQRIVHAPSRMLMGTDEFFQQMNYRMNVRARAMRSAREAGVTNPDEFARRVTADVSASYSGTGAGTNPLALDYSRVATFKNSLGEGTLGQSLQDISAKHPAFRIIFPFVRTPVNLFRWQWERAPGLNRFSRIVQADLAAGGERAAIAKAKVQIGTAMWSAAAYLAFTGRITGRGPRDPELRAQWLSLGNKPYSIRLPGVGNISFRRADPTFSMLGMVADIVGMSGDMSPQDTDRATQAMVASVMSNLTSKTFMQGVSETLDAISSGNANAVQSAMQSFAGSFVPNLFNQLNPDQTFREAESVVDEISKRIPGLSTELEPRRNFLGDKVMAAPGYLNDTFNPFTWSPSHPEGVLSDELLAFGRSLSMPAPTLNGGRIDLKDRDAFGANSSAAARQSPYDRWMELLGTRVNGAPSLREDLMRMMESDAYKAAGYGNEAVQGGTKFILLNSIVQAHIGLAYGKMLSEYPALRDAMSADAQLQGQGYQSSQDITNLLTPRR